MAGASFDSGQQTTTSVPSRRKYARLIRADSSSGLRLFKLQYLGLAVAMRTSEVRLWATSADIHLTVGDFGLGFDVETAKQSRGLGLVSMEERLNWWMESFPSSPNPSVAPRSTLACRSDRESIPCVRPCDGTQAYILRIRLVLNVPPAMQDYFPIFPPMTSPETTISTRRFSCRPVAVALSATGVDIPNPCAVTLPSRNP